jgi:hypothetical protein
VFARSIVALSTVALVVPVAAALAHPDWAGSLGLDVWNLPALHEKVADATEEARDLEDDRLDTFRRLEVKEGLIQKLIAGRATLAETTTHFLTLDENRPEIMAVIRNLRPGATDEEKMARNVIQYTLPPLDGQPFFRRTAVVVRLEAELREFVASGTPAGAH